MKKGQVPNIDLKYLPHQKRHAASTNSCFGSDLRMELTMTEAYVSDSYVRPTVAVDSTKAIRRMSWGAVLAGAAVVLSMQLLLSLLGLGIGLATIDPAVGDTPDAASFGIATAIFYAIVTLLSLFAGGWVAGRLAGMPVRADGLLHGLVTWSVAMLLLLYVVTTSVGALLSGTLGMVGSALQAAGQGVQAAAGAAAQSDVGEEAMNNIEQQAQQLLGQAQQATGAQDTSEARLQQLQTQYEEARAAAEEQAREIAQATSEAVSQGAFWAFVALLCGAIAAAVGGLVGTPRDLSVEARRVS
jgi:hypothetical protein